MDYEEIIVESYNESGSGLHGKIHIRPIPDQGDFLPDMRVECSKKLSKEYPVGTRFLIRAKITDREGGNPFIYSSYQWPFEVLED